VPRLKCTFRDFIAIIEARGFVADPDGKGSHRQYRHKDGRRVTIAYHNIGDIPAPETLASMIRQSELPKKLFRK
jgi:predicted RNA binding protein YcfA (HicA-like mRNA interferase family)